MEWVRLCPVAALFYVLGCSSTPQNPGDLTGGGNGSGGSGDDSGVSATSSSGGSGGSSGGSAGGSGSGGGSSGGAGSTSGSSGGASRGGDASTPSGEGGLTTTTDGGLPNDPDIDTSVAPVTLTMTPFQVPAGGEVYYCQNFANPWGAQQVDIKVYSLNMGIGSHHMFAFYQSNATNGSVAPCPNGGLEFGAFTFVSQSAKKTVDFPQSVGATIPADTGFQLMVHYLNTSDEAITSDVALTMYIAKPGAVTQHAGVLFLSNSTMTVSSTCTTGCPSTDSYTLTQDVNVLSTEGHMHKYGTDFVTTVSPAGQVPNGQLYETTIWNEPEQLEFSPAVLLPSGTTVTWTCTDVNNTGELLTFGESAVTNVMCISQSIIYPITDVNNPVLGSSIGGL